MSTPWLGQSSVGFHQLRAERTQNGCVKAVADAKFMGEPGHTTQALAAIHAKGIIHE